ncbi:MAG: hypothetical protein LiPW15_97 [Parcubacteria group bacterium LiPW_15]|nr:MAG: hypothetical protein LiPW15_97 [Parcubacteria group bacterium LiPW_15]
MTASKRVLRLRKKRDEIWKAFLKLPKRGSFSGIHLANQLEKVQQQLDKLEGKRKSKRYLAEVHIEIF